ncbi:hypothetical protein H4I96_07040 [Botrytis cinerea]
MSSTTPIGRPVSRNKLPRSPITQLHMEPEQAEGLPLLGEGVNTGSRGKGKGRDTMPQPPAEDKFETLRLLQPLAASVQELHGRISDLEPTNLTSKLKAGVEPKVNLWLQLVSERLELYESSLTSKSQRRSYVVDQTEGEAQEHILALYIQIPELAGQELAYQLAAIYRNPAEVDHARTEYEHWVMPNTTQRAEVTGQQTLLRDLDRKISDFLARAVALHYKSCTTIDALADKLTEIDELEVSIRERNRYRPAREVAKKPGANSNSHQLTMYIDHKALEYFMSTKSLNARQALQLLADALTRRTDELDPQNHTKKKNRLQQLIKNDRIDTQILSETLRMHHSDEISIANIDI